MEESDPLVGVWQTDGRDAELGDVTVLLELESTGVLAVSLVLDGGGRLSFAGAWQSAGDSLFLRGSYFQPDGEARVAYAVSGDTLLVLRQGEAPPQQWRRL